MVKSRIFFESAFVGRNRELEELLQSLASAMERHGQIILISGEAGLGKTRLVTHFLGSLSERVPITTLTGQCLKDSGKPYYPFLEAFNANFESQTKKKEFTSSQKTDSKLNFGNSSELISWLNGPIGPFGSIEISPQTWKNRTFRAVKETFLSICAKTTLLFFIEDIQFADSATLELLQYIAKSMLSERLLVIATSNGNLEANNEKNGSLTDYIKLMKESGHLVEISLSCLSLSEVSSLAAQMIGKSLQSDFAQKLHKESHGNPLFIIEYLRMLYEKQSGSIDKTQEFAITTETNFPTNLKRLILLRTEKLTPEQRKILNIASVLTAKFDVAFLSSLSGRNNIETADAFQNISEVYALFIRDGLYYRFDHQKTREIVYDEIPDEERKIYHSRIALELEKNNSDGSIPQIGIIAYHYSRSNMKEKAIHFSLSAGKNALASMSNTEAIRHFKYVVDNTMGIPQYVSQWEEATESLGDAFLSVEIAEAIKVFEKLYEQTKSQLVKIRASRKAASAYLLHGNCDLAFAAIRKPVSFADVDQLEVARFKFTKGMVESRCGHISDALEDLQSSLKVFEEMKSLPDIIDVSHELSMAYMYRPAQDASSMGQPEEALASILRTLAICEQIGDLEKQFYSLVVAFVITNECGYCKQTASIIDEVSKTIQKMEEPKSKSANEAWRWWLSSYLTESRTMDRIFSKIYEKLEFDLSPTIKLTKEDKQDFRAAIDMSKKGVEIAQEIGSLEIQGLLYGNLTREYCFDGELEKSEAHREKLEKIFNKNLTLRFVLEKSMYLFSKALFFSFKRQWEEANKSFQESIEHYNELRPGTCIESSIRQWYCCALLQQGRFEDGMRQLTISKTIINNLEKRLKHANIISSIMVPSSVQVDKEYTIRLDFANVGKNPALLAQFEGLITPSFNIISTTPVLNLKETTAEMDNKEISAFKNEVYTLTIKATKPGTYTLSPEIIYYDDLGQKKKSVIEPVTITVHPSQIPTSKAPPTPKINSLTEESRTHSTITAGSKPFQVFLCYKKSSAKDFADHLKAGLEELGLHTFIDSKDIPRIVEGQEEWTRFRDKALEESKFFVLIMTPGFHLSAEVVKEIDMARKQVDKTFIFFRHRNMGRKIVVNFANDSLDIGKLEQVSFESQEELLRLAVNLLPCSKPS
jgi:predicted ATPase